MIRKEVPLRKLYRVVDKADKRELRGIDWYVESILLYTNWRMLYFIPQEKQGSVSLFLFRPVRVSLDWQ